MLVSSFYFFLALLLTRYNGPAIHSIWGGYKSGLEKLKVAAVGEATVADYFFSSEIGYGYKLTMMRNRFLQTKPFKKIIWSGVMR